jgi:hypothetical protein
MLSQAYRPTVHPATQAASELYAECDVQFQRRSGPGGQHRNKVETAVRLRHRPSQVTAQASERRAQAENLQVALERLRRALAVRVRTAWHEPSKLWRNRCRAGRLSVNPRHMDYPSLLAEAIDALEACDWQLTLACGQLGCSNTQLVRLLRHEAAALRLLNAHRADRGLTPLK